MVVCRFVVSIQPLFLQYDLHDILVMRSFHAYPHSVVGFNCTSTFCLVFSNCATGFPARTMLKFTRHCCWHRNFQLSSSICHFSLEFLIVRVNEVNTTQTSGIVELWFLDFPLLLLFAFRCIGHMFPHLWP